MSYGEFRSILAHGPAAGGPRGGLPGVPRDVRGRAQHVRGALQRRVPARLVRGAGPRLRLDARRRAARQQHSAVPSSRTLIAVTRANTPTPLRRYHRAAQARPGPRPLLHLRRPGADRRRRAGLRLRRGPGVGRSASVAPLGPATRRACGRSFARPQHRRLRERGQAQRRLLGAGVRRAPVHAAEPQRHARRGVHAGPRDGPQHAHRARPRAPAVRLLGLHDLRGRGALDAERGAAARATCSPQTPRSPRARSCCCEHAIENIAGTFFTQVLFADYELRAHRLVEADQPITADDPERPLRRNCIARLLRRRVRRRAAGAADVGARAALLSVAVLRVPVRHVLRVGGPASPTAILGGDPRPTEPAPSTATSTC